MGGGQAGARAFTFRFLVWGGVQGVRAGALVPVVVGGWGRACHPL